MQLSEHVQIHLLFFVYILMSDPVPPPPPPPYPPSLKFWYMYMINMES